MKFRLSILIAAAFLTSCGSITVPAAAVSSTGENFKGSATGSATAGTFDLTGTSGNKCSGKYDPLSSARVLVVPVNCTHGQTGTITVNRDADLMGGEGTGTFSDGSTSTLQFGTKRLPG